jgi:hypothetical protein
MFQHPLNPTTQKLTAGVIAAAMLAWPAAGADNSAIPNFSPDSRTGWVAGVLGGVSPIGHRSDDVLLGIEEAIHHHWHAEGYASYAIQIALLAHGLVS